MLVSSFKPLWFPEFVPLEAPHLQWRQDRALQSMVSFWKCYTVHTSLFQEAAGALERTEVTAGPKVLLSETQPAAPQELSLTVLPGALGCPMGVRGEPGLTPGGESPAPSCRLWQLQGPLRWPATHSSSAHAVDEQQWVAWRHFSGSVDLPRFTCSSTTLLRPAAENHCLSVVNIGHSILG